MCCRQRAFRERKESRLRELEEELARVNARYNALANEHRQITTQLLALMAEKKELLGTVPSATDACSPLSPEPALGSRRTSVADTGTEVLLNSECREEEEEGRGTRPENSQAPAILPTDAGS